MKTYYPGNLGGNDRRFNRNPNYDSGMGNKQSGMYRRNGMQRKKGPDAEAALTEGISAVKDYLREIVGFQKRLAESQDRIAQAQQAHAQAMQQIAACVKHFLGKDLDDAQPEASPTVETMPPLDEPMPVVDEAATAAAPAADGEPVFGPAPEKNELSAEPASEENELSAEPASEENELSAEPASEESELPAEPASEETETDSGPSEPVLKLIAEMRENGFSYEKIAEHLDTRGIPQASGNGKWTRWNVSKLYKEAFL